MRPEEYATSQWTLGPQYTYPSLHVVSEPKAGELHRQHTQRHTRAAAGLRTVSRRDSQGVALSLGPRPVAGG